MTDHALLTDEELAAIESRAEAAAPGPWMVDSDGCCIHWGNDFDEIAERVPTSATAAFIAGTRTDVPRLIADLRASRAEAERLRAIIASIPEVIGEVTRDALLYGDGWVQNTPHGLRRRDPQAVAITERSPSPHVASVPTN